MLEPPLDGSTDDVAGGMDENCDYRLATPSLLLLRSFSYTAFAKFVSRDALLIETSSSVSTELES